MLQMAMFGCALDLEQLNPIDCRSICQRTWDCCL